MNTTRKKKFDKNQVKERFNRLSIAYLTYQIVRVIRWSSTRSTRQSWSLGATLPLLPRGSRKPPKLIPSICSGMWFSVTTSYTWTPRSFTPFIAMWSSSKSPTFPSRSTSKWLLEFVTLVCYRLHLKSQTQKKTRQKVFSFSHVLHVSRYVFFFSKIYKGKAMIHLYWMDYDLSTQP